MQEQAYDVIIIGGGISGLTAAFVSSQLGHKTLLIEQGKVLGGNNRSFTNPNGCLFDSGHHALDENRSATTTRFFKRVLNNQYHRFALKRGIAIENHLFDYNAPLQHWPSELKTFFANEDFIDDIEAPITEAKLKRVYGDTFANYAIDSILASYPSKKWALDNGGQSSDHLDYIYPWFFPRAKKTAQRTQEWENYHDNMRDQAQQSILYPCTGGFQRFPEAIAEACNKDNCTIVTDAKNRGLTFEFDDNNPHEITQLSLDGKPLSFEKILWCAPVPALLALIGKPVKLKPLQELYLGNFEFEHELSGEFHEILVGSTQHRINRITFPGKLSKTQNRTVQVEFYFPQGQHNKNENEWQDHWLNSLQKLGIAAADNAVASFQLQSSIAGVVTRDSFQSVSELLQEKLNGINGNINLPYPIIGPENINRIIPQVIANTTKLLTQGG